MTNEDLAMDIREGRAGYGPLWEQVQRHVIRQAYQYYTLHEGLCKRAGVEVDDLFQCGFPALQAAVNAFDPEKGYKLLTYMSRPLLNQFREACGIRTSRRDPLDLAVRLDQPVSEEDESVTLGELTPDPQAEAARINLEEDIYTGQLHNALERAMDTLDDQQRDVIRRRYYGGETLDRIAARWGATREQVRRTEQKALAALHRPRSRRMLESFHEEIISRYAWRGTGWSSFRSNGASSVERAAEKADERMRQDKTYICSLLHIAPEEFDRRYCGRWETPLQRGCKEP